MKFPKMGWYGAGFPTTTRRVSGSFDLAARAFSGAAFCRRTSDRRHQRSVPMDFSLRCLQALRQCRLPGGVSDGLDRAHRIRSVFVQPDVCNGCGYCVVSCPFGVIDKRPHDGRAFKCTFCYDRQKAGLIPACAKACPTESIQFGDLDELKQRGKKRVQELHQRGYTDARIYDPQETSVGGINAFFIILGEPEAYNLPPAPEVPTAYLKSAWTSALCSAAILFTIVCIAFAI